MRMGIMAAAVGPSPCDWYPASFEQGGVYINIRFAVGPQGAKLSKLDNLLTEVISGGESVIINLAICGDV